MDDSKYSNNSQVEPRGNLARKVFTRTHEAMQILHNIKTNSHRELEEAIQPDTLVAEHF